MLPKNRLGRRLATKLKIYAGPEHPHAAQQPVAIDPLAAAATEEEPSMPERTVTHAATGKRKTAVARVRLVAGEGKIPSIGAPSRTISAARRRA